MTLRLTGEGHQAAHRLAGHVRGESPFMSRRSCQRESDGSNPKPFAAPEDDDGRLPGACARYTTAPASGTTPAATSAPPQPHVPAARPSPHGPRSLRKIGAEPIVVIAARCAETGTASPGSGSKHKATP